MTDSSKPVELKSSEELVNDFVEEFTKDCRINKEENSHGTSDEKQEEPQKYEDDYVDEVELKDREISLSPEDVQRLHADASTLKDVGNELFKHCKYVESVEKYTLALRTCPLEFSKDRAIFYANRAAAKVKLERTESALEDCTKAIELDEHYIKALLRRASLYNSSEKYDEALQDYTKVLELDRTNREANEAAMRLPKLIEERNERLKTEMLGKLKDLGNVILKPFGLSTNNFQMVQNSETGGYSINFKQ